MGLELRREALGDIVLPEDQPGTAYVFALEPAAQLICRELFQAGHTELTTELLTLDEVPQFPQAEREMHSATVSSCGWTLCWQLCCTAAEDRLRN